MNLKNTKVECICTDMTVDGYGICKYEGLVIFVKQMLIGEKAIVKIIAHKKNLAYGIIDTLLAKSEHRVTSICPVAYKCGGCDLRHCDYHYGLVIKKKLLQHTMEMADIHIDVQDIVASPLIDHYRNKVQIPVVNAECGFYRKNSNDIVKFDTCFIQTINSNAILNDLKNLLHKYHMASFVRHIIIREAFGSGEVMVALVVTSFELREIEPLVAELCSKHRDISSFILNLNTRDDNVVLGEEEKVLYGSSYIVDKYFDLEVEISLKSFYQVNYQQMLNLYAKIKEISGIDDNTSVLDLYSGIGTIGLYLAKYARKVSGVEIVPAAVENAKANARRNHLENITFYLSDAKDNLFGRLDDIDIVVVDPPRKGLNASVIKDIAAKDINKVIYVSCNPATLARDLNLFKEAGYSFDTLYPFDMFPHTMHVETVVLMSRVKGE